MLPHGDKTRQRLMTKYLGHFTELSQPGDTHHVLKDDGSVISAARLDRIFVKAGSADILDMAHKFHCGYAQG